MLQASQCCTCTVRHHRVIDTPCMGWSQASDPAECSSNAGCRFGIGPLNDFTQQNDATVQQSGLALGVGVSSKITGAELHFGLIRKGHTCQHSGKDPSSAEDSADGCPAKDFKTFRASQQSPSKLTVKRCLVFLTRPVFEFWGNAVSSEASQDLRSETSKAIRADCVFPVSLVANLIRLAPRHCGVYPCTEALTRPPLLKIQQGH